MATRKRLRLETPQRSCEQDSAGATAMTTVAETLRTVIQEVRLLREEQARREREYAETFRRQEEELRLLRGTNPGSQTQLSHSYNRASGDSGTRDASGMGARVTRQGVAISSGAETRDAYEAERDAISSVAGAREHASESVAVASAELGYKLKPDTYDGTVPLQEYFSQLSLIARANRWDDATKTIALASSLRGKARSVLETVQDVERLDFAELKTKLELRFGEGRQSQNCYVAFTNRKQKFGEDLATLGSEIDKLSRLAYPECPFELRDKIACAQFVTAVSDNFIRRALQMEGIASLNAAVERAKAFKIIQGDNFERNRGNSVAENEKCSTEEKSEGKEKEGKGPKGNWRGSKFSAGRGECWTCGKAGHYRSECPNEGNAI